MRRIAITSLAAVVALAVSLPVAIAAPATTSASFNDPDKSVTATSDKDLSNVVLQFCDNTGQQKFDGLNQKVQTFRGTGSYAGKSLQGIWIKSGSNQSGDGPGYGEYHKNMNPTACGGQAPPPVPPGPGVICLPVVVGPPVCIIIPPILN